MESGDVSAEDEKIISEVSFTIYTGGPSFANRLSNQFINSIYKKAASDTVISSTNTFLYLMVTHPEVLEKAQKELDEVIGRHRLPDFEDRASLPYIEAIYREVLRWKPPVPMGVSHRATKDDTYKGYFIPEGLALIYRDVSRIKFLHSFNFQQELRSSRISGMFFCKE